MPLTLPDPPPARHPASLDITPSRPERHVSFRDICLCCRADEATGCYCHLLRGLRVTIVDIETEQVVEILESNDAGYLDDSLARLLAAQYAGPQFKWFATVSGFMPAAFPHDHAGVKRWL